jgi:4-amino-4-deoxychorismate lyase
MSLLVESIKVERRAAFNLDLHSARMNTSRQQLFGLHDEIDLREALKIPEDLSSGLFKCRVVYAERIQSIEYLPYVPQVIASLELVEDTMIEYKHKFVDRLRIDLLKSKSKADDIVIVQDGRLTDASHANVVLFDGKNWKTPAHPLLLGTKRQVLLREGRITEEDILTRDVRLFKKVALINALRDLDELMAIDIRNVY